MPGSDPTLQQSGFSDQATSLTTSDQSFTVRFWGVRGSIPTPGKDTVRYGGNTACVEVNVAGKRLIFDGGTGLRRLGEHLQKESPVEAHLFFTHTHWDRIQGFPFFMPAFQSGNCFHIYGSIGPNGASIKQRLYDQMLRPNFPVPLQFMKSDLQFNNISPGSVITLDDVVVETVSLNHPNNALGYRITWGGYTVVYATDTEHDPDKVDQGLMYLSHRADLLIYDAAYADHAYYDSQFIEEFQQAEVWQKGVELVLGADVRKIAIFHHDPAHEDDCLDEIEAHLQSRYPNVILAREGMVIDVNTLKHKA
jgi:phosphoribosyl 1,2-cyclic phosphodiesterase